MAGKKMLVIAAAVVLVIAAAVLIVVPMLTPKQDRASFSTVGNTVRFGAYPQGESGGDRTPIEWTVLDVQGGRALLISRYGLDVKPYHTEYAEVTWAECSLRAWLNSGFLDTAFSEKERAGIPVTDVDNGTGQGYGNWRYDGAGTQDRVFLLSFAEAQKYYAVRPYDKSGSGENEAARAAATPYAVWRGGYAAKEFRTAENRNATTWWLRSPGSTKYDAAIILGEGSLNFREAVNANVCVRPAIWVDLDADIF